MSAFKKKSIYIVGTSSTPLTLTGTYQTGNALFVGEAEKAGLDIAYTMGTAESGNSMQMIVEFSGDDGDTIPTNWYREVEEAKSSGTVTETMAERTFAAVSAAGTYDRRHISIPLESKWIRVSVKETGISSNGGNTTVIATITIT